MSETGNSYTLRIWRQAGPDRPGRMATYTVSGIPPEISLMETLDLLNEDLIRKGEDPVAFENDCREGICGQCGIVVDGLAHGGKRGCATCELRMRDFQPGATITLEPFRARAFPIVKDLVTDRSALDRIVARGGYVSVNTGAAVEANAVPVPTAVAEKAMDAAACIGCGACVAACPNASASLFVGAKVTHLATMPQGHPEREQRVRRMARQMDAEGFGACSNHGECESVCPKRIPVQVIAKLRRERIRAALRRLVE